MALSTCKISRPCCIVRHDSGPGILLRSQRGLLQRSPSCNRPMSRIQRRRAYNFRTLQNPGPWCSSLYSVASSQPFLRSTFTPARNPFFQSETSTFHFRSFSSMTSRHVAVHYSPSNGAASFSGFPSSRFSTFTSVPNHRANPRATLHHIQLSHSASGPFFTIRSSTSPIDFFKYSVSFQTSISSLALLTGDPVRTTLVCVPN